MVAIKGSVFNHVTCSNPRNTSTCNFMAYSESGMILINIYSLVLCLNMARRSYYYMYYLVSFGSWFEPFMAVGLGSRFCSEQGSRI